MAVRVQATFDAADPQKLADFWALALAEHAARLVNAGTSRLRKQDEVLGCCIVMQDPEG